MNSQTMIETLEKHFEKVNEKTKHETLAEAVSNTLCSVMPRISLDLFERRRESTIKLTDEQRLKIDEWYLRFRKLDRSWNVTFYPTRVCKGEIGIFQYVTVPDTIDIVCGTAKITYEDGPYAFNTNDKNCNGEHLILARTTDSRIIDHYNMWFWNDKELGNAEVAVKSVWTAPFTLNVCTQVPQVPEVITELSDLAMFQYYKEANNAIILNGHKSSLQKPKLGVLWAPTDELLYCTGNVPTPKKYPPIDIESDPALVLEIPDGKKKYRHVIATWDYKNEKPFKNWLAEYTE